MEIEYQTTATAETDCQVLTFESDTILKILLENHSHCIPQVRTISYGVQNLLHLC